MTVPMSNNEKVGNIIAFLAILFGEDNNAWEAVMDFNPNYIIEKFERYVLSCRIEHPWGLHPALRMKRFHNYLDKWKLELINDSGK